MHGANRLASNSLLEGLVFGLRLADGLAGMIAKQAIASSRQALIIPVYDDLSSEKALLSVRPDRESIHQMRREIRQVMWQYVSLQRDRQGLLEATQQLHSLRNHMLAIESVPQNNALEWLETVNMLKVAELVIAAALQRRESRGSHSRLDHPNRESSLRAAARARIFRAAARESSLRAAARARIFRAAARARPYYTTMETATMIRIW